MNKKNGFISMTLVYTFLIVFLFLMLAILASYQNKDKYLETINSKIDYDITKNMRVKNNVINTILKDNVPYQYIKTKEDGTTSYSFKLINMSGSQNPNGTGLFYSDDLNINDEDNNGISNRIYFFRGNVETNHLVFAGKCWRIIRSNEDGSLRIRYNGVRDANGSCPTLGKYLSDLTRPEIGVSNNTKVSYSNEEGKLGYIVNGEIADASNEQSNIKTVLDKWYLDNIINYTRNGVTKSYDKYVAPSIFCNDKSENILNLIPRFKEGLENHNSYKDSNFTNFGTYKCVNLADRYNRYTELTGNRLLHYPIGTLTAEDLVYAGAYFTDDMINEASNNLVNNSHAYDEYHGLLIRTGANAGNRIVANTSYYLYTGEEFWTMSAYVSKKASINKIVYSDINGTLRPSSTLNKYKVYPVISLKANNVISSGVGSASDPYIIKE